MKEKILTLAGIMLFLNILFPAFISAELTDFSAEIIRIAFINGYVNAMDSDIETIKTIKEDRNKMKKYSDMAVKSYLAKVTDLNSADPKMPNNNEEIKKESSISYWSRGW